MQRVACVISVFVAIAAASGLAMADRPKPRPEKTARQREAYISQLRDWYAGAPETWPAPTIDEGVDWVELGPIPGVQHPEDNPGGKLKIELGKQLFFDPRLSGSGQIACASCHDPDLGWGDGRATSFGHNRIQLTRNAPPVLNSGFKKRLFWDGRAASLEEQASDVLNNADEMHSSEAVVVEQLRVVPEYTEAFEQVFGQGGLTGENAIRAIASFERTLVSGRSRFDYFLNGRRNALPDEGLAGLHLFRTAARCMNCHNGPLMTDNRFHNLGISNYGRRFEDLGRYKVTDNTEDVGAFQTPSLRNVMQNAPYMHSGLFNLDELLVLYNGGMRNERPRKDQLSDPLFPRKSSLLQPLGLNEQDFSDLRSFLSSLSEPHVRVLAPELPGL